MNRFKTFLTLFCAAAIAGLSTSTASAADDVIITVKVDVALDSYYKLVDFATELQEAEAEVGKKAQEMQLEATGLIEEFQELREHANSDILTDEAKQEAVEDAQAMIQTIQAKETAMRQFLSDEQNKFRARQQQQMNLFYQEIAEVIVEISKERGATLVIDVSARAGDGRATVLYTDGSYDITPEVIERINSTKPEEEAATEE